MAVLNRSMEFKVPRDREKSTTLEAGAGERAPGEPSKHSHAGTLEGRNPEREVGVGSAAHARVCVCTGCSTRLHPFLRPHQEMVSGVHHAH